ncbi:MAG TPA: MarC family protein [Chthoniobacterales bacterium]|nr:MarC family protein [Chthoniobacterales bacterium]
MEEFGARFLQAFIPLFVAIDPIALVAIFITLGAPVDERRRRCEGNLGLLTGLAISIGFIFLGQAIFKALGITVGDFQVAGGLILLGLAVRELLDLGGENRPAGEAFGVVPLGMPLIAGPALLTALLLLVDTVGITMTIVALVVNLALVSLAFRNADRLARLLGKRGLNGASKLISLLLAAIAVSLIRRGWQMP